MFAFTKICFVLILVNFACALIPIVYENFEDCADEDERAGVFDFSEIEIIAESDENVYMNGSWNFLKEVRSPWKVTLFTERYERSEWNVEAISKKIPDFCEVIQGRSEPWYHVTSKFEPKECPFPAGTKINFPMQSLTEMPMELPQEFAGKWRLNFIGEFGGEDGKKECRRIYFDLVEN